MIGGEQRCYVKSKEVLQTKVMYDRDSAGLRVAGGQGSQNPLVPHQDPTVSCDVNVY